MSGTTLSKTTKGREIAFSCAIPKLALRSGRQTSRSEDALRALSLVWFNIFIKDQNDRTECTLFCEWYHWEEQLLRWRAGLPFRGTSSGRETGWQESAREQQVLAALQRQINWQQDRQGKISLTRIQNVESLNPSQDQVLTQQTGPAPIQ